MVPHVPILLTHNYKDAVAFAYGTCFSVFKQLAPGFGKNGAEENVGGTIELNKKNWTEKNENFTKKKVRQNQGSCASSTDYADDLDWENYCC